MGVKFIKLDEESKAVIDRLVGTRGSKDGAFDVGERTSQPSSEPTAQAIKVPRKGTMIGLGAVSPEVPRASAPAQAPEPEEKPSEGFFPSGAPAEQPPPEDRTVMRQAAELLRDALIEAGGSMEEIGSTGAAPVLAAPNESENAARHVSVAPPAITERPKATEKVESAAVARDIQSQSTKPPPGEKSDAARPSSRPSGRVEQRPLPSSVPSNPQKGGSKPALMLLGVAAIGGGLFWLTQQSKPPAEPAPQAEPGGISPPAPEPIAPTEVPAAASAEAPAPAPSASAAPPVEETPTEKAARLKAEAASKKAEEDAAKKAAEDAKKAEAAAKKAEEAAAKKAELEAKKAAAAAAAAAAPKPAAPKPKAVAPKPPPPAAETPPAAAPPPPSPPAEKPAEAVKPAEAAKPAAPAPAPAPTTAPAPPKETPKETPPAAPKAPPPAAPKAPESDNPY
jgi:hypothetical protein